MIRIKFNYLLIVINLRIFSTIKPIPEKIYWFPCTNLSKTRPKSREKSGGKANSTMGKRLVLITMKYPLTREWGLHPGSKIIQEPLIKFKESIPFI